MSTGPDLSGAERTEPTAASSHLDPGSNRRLTSLLGVTLNSLLGIQVISALAFFLLALNVALPSGPIYAVVRPVHFFIGFMLIPLTGLKILSTVYRFLRYYTGDRAYKNAGAPHLLARAIAPLLILSLLVVMVSGVEMWSFANQFGVAWIPVHVFSSIAFTALLAVHIGLHVREAHREAALDLAAVPTTKGAMGEGIGSDRRNRVARRTVLATGLASGLALAVSAAQVPAVTLSWLAPRRAGSDALDFPIMNFEGGGQRVDIMAWRLRVSGVVDQPLELTYADILRFSNDEHEYEVNCVTGWTATRRWRGVPVATVLQRAGAHQDFGNVLFRSTSGYHWSHTRDNCLLAGALLVTHIDGVQLNDDHGFPVRLMIPGTVGQSNVKWIDGLVVGMGAPEVYGAPNLTYDPSLPVSGHLLPANPAGRRS